MRALPNYPLPWRTETRVKERSRTSGICRVLILDANGNEVCEVSGETRTEAEEAAIAICEACNT